MIYVLYIPKRYEVFIRGIVKKSTADVILLNKFKRIIAIKEKVGKIQEVSVSLLLKTKGTYSGHFCLKFYL